MTTSAPPATGVRTPWEALPAAVRDAVGETLGAPVVRSQTQRGGFSPGVAARVRTAAGGTGFVKAVSAEANPHSPVLHRREARVAAALPAAVPAPRLLGTYDDGTWVALVFEEVAGRQPHVPWRPDELRRVLDALTVLARTGTPCTLDVPPVAEDLAEAFSGWRRLLDGEAGGVGGVRDRLGAWAADQLPELAALEARWSEGAAGDTLAHADVRADNVLLTADGRVAFVDWPHALRAAPWFDLLVMLPCVRAQGGPDPEEVFTAHPLGRDADPDAVTAALAALTGYFLRSSLNPAPPGLPTLRPFQRAQGDAASAWLRRRLRQR
ncbi:aminoglycoside phosphotransferase [Streptomyces sp. MUSC 14]|uniref:aminoglycoside phosphotransferase n=1 Tax=Streptomyces sp. MUSC 14 TaxID=1354889 RepID=UPI0008F573C5|nr:aminoglycoside phosphotransferase [Streptomyces sp. MUSC 14]OIJ86924.1 aminoglycoside phosphotransferase [Streptomyces sp. MUSC 14]